MRIRATKILADPQREQPLAYCPRCGGEIYRYDPVGDLGGQLVHAGCIPSGDRFWVPVAPAVSFFEETC